jgi:hypothetical protein
MPGATGNCVEDVQDPANNTTTDTSAIRRMDSLPRCVVP